MTSTPRRLALLLLHAAVAATSAQGDEASADAARKKTLERKLVLVESLSAESPLAQRIASSGNSAAVALFAEARASAADARSLLDTDRHDVAEEAIDTALRAVTEASRMVADRQRELRTQQARYRELRQRILSFREAFERVAAEKRGERLLTTRDEARMDRLLADASALAGVDDYAAANMKLRSLATEVEGALSRARHQETLTHKLVFASAEEEYMYEQQRNRSYEMLIALLQSQRSPSQTARKTVDAMLERNKALRTDAQALADRGETAAALAKLEQATEYLMRTLKMSGLAFP